MFGDLWQKLKRGGEQDGVHPHDQGPGAWFIVLLLPFLLAALAMVVVAIWP